MLGAGKPVCGNGRMLGPWKDSDGTDRYACVYEPASVKPGRRLPLLVYLHPSLFGTWTIKYTNLLDLQRTDSLSAGDSPAAGYVILAPEGRKTTHRYPWPDNSGIGWDNWYRQLNPAGDVRVGATVYRENVDAATIDHFIAEAAAGGNIDTRRIYVAGWSNGAAMAILYAVNRPDVSAAAVYSAPDPFGAMTDRCAQKPVDSVSSGDAEVRIYNPRAAIMNVHNACDVSGICPNGEKLAAELQAAGVDFDDVILDASGRRVEACVDECGVNPNGGLSFFHHPISWWTGLRHHQKWPRSWWPRMLQFLRSHPLRPATPPF
jgi:dienelactone hydrolase